MLNTIFGGIFDTQSTTVISVWKFLLCVGVALVIGVILAAVYSYKNRYTKSFLVTLAILPAMAAGLIAGMGYLGYAVLFTVVLCGCMLLYNKLSFGSRKNVPETKVLHITIPEDLDYTGVFDEVLEKYTSAHELVQVKTTNMGSLFRLTYELVLSSADVEKELIDKLRCRNGNLEISVSRKETTVNEL